MSDEDLILTESDEENEIQDLQQLNAVLLSDDHCTSTSLSQYSTSTKSIYNDITKYEQCSKIEAALALNHMCDQKLRRLENVLTSRLQECRKRLVDIKQTTHVENENRMEIFHYVNCGKPYFKDSSNFPAPDNEDTILMAKSDMYDFSLTMSVCGWTVRDKSNFLKLIHVMSQDIRKVEINSKIAELIRQIKTADTKTISKINNKIASLKSEINKVSKMSLEDLALPINREYDWYSIANKLNRRHSPSEYQSLWKLYLHPSINKKTWSRSEHLSLQRIAFKEKLQDWDVIAAKLGTGRTNYQCFVYYRTNMSNSFTRKKWTKEETEYLKRLIDYYKEGTYIPWGKVATSMENRTKIQIYNKYLSLCQQRKGRFLPEEDAVILTCVENFGPNFQKMTKYLPGRTSAQCRVRYQVLEKKRISTVWTVEEDKRLIQLMASQDSTTNYSGISQYFPGKDRIHIRARYLTLTKWMVRNPSLDITKAPRRGARRLGHGQSSDDLNKAIEKLKNRIQSEVITAKSKKVSSSSPEEIIDDAIIACLATEHIKSLKPRKLEDLEEQPQIDCLPYTDQNLNINNLKKILILLRANLNKEKLSAAKKYSGLLEPDIERVNVQIKSYSRKSSVKNISIDPKPDIWGNHRLGPLMYVFPPNYATITGCKKLINYSVPNVDSQPKTDDEGGPCVIKNILRKNMFVKEQIFLIMERFNALFLWSMLLSNTSPKFHDLEYNVQIEKPTFVCHDEDDYNLALPCYETSNCENAVIDLQEPQQPENNCITIDLPLPNNLTLEY